MGNLRAAAAAAALAGLTVITAPVAPTAVAASAPATAPAYGATWVAVASSNELIEYAEGAHGAATPVVTISGADTGLSSPSAVTVLPDGSIYVANAGNNSIAEFAPGATGDAQPVTTISGPLTQLDGPSSVAYDEVGALDEIWVANPEENMIEGFDVGESGNVYPAKIIFGSKTKLDHPTQISIAPGGFGLWALNTPVGGSASVVGLDNFDAGDTAADPDLTSTKVGVADATAILANDLDGVVVAEAGSFNRVVSYFYGFNGKLASAIELQGAHTQLDDPTAISADAAGRFEIFNQGNDSLTEYPADPDVDSAPARVVTGFGGGGSANAIWTIAGPPGSPTHVRVQPINNGAKVSWQPPIDTGGAVVHYEVFEFQESANGDYSTFVSLGNGPTATHRTVHGVTDGVPYEYLVEANNFEGTADSEFVTATSYGPPTRPRSVAVTPSSRRGSLTVAWAAPLSDGGKAITGYRVTLSCATGKCATRRVRASASSTSATITGLRRQADYVVNVSAINFKGAGKPGTATGSSA